MPPFPLLCRLGALAIRVWWWWLIGDLWDFECLEIKVKCGLVLWVFFDFVAVQYLATSETSQTGEHEKFRVLHTAHNT